MKIRSKILAILGVPLVFLGGSTLATLDSSAQTAERLEEERKAVAVQSAFQQVERDLSDAESATKGYLITGQRGLLAPYTNAVARLPRDMTALTELAGDSRPVAR